MEEGNCWGGRHASRKGRAGAAWKQALGRGRQRAVLACPLPPARAGGVRTDAVPYPRAAGAVRSEACRRRRGWRGRQSRPAACGLRALVAAAPGERVSGEMRE